MIRPSEETIKRALRALLGAVLAGLAILLLLFVLSMLFIPKNNTARDGIIDQKANGILGEPGNTIDVLFVGDSEVLSAFSPLEIWGEYGFTSYDCAMKGHRMPDRYSLLLQATENQKPKVVVIETHDCYSPFTPGMAFIRSVQDALPVLEYHDRWKSLTFADVTEEPDATWTDDLKGFYLNTDVEPANDEGHMAPTDEVEKLAIMNRWYLKMMIDHCRKIGAEPVLVSSPSTYNWNTARHNGIVEFAKGANVEYIDLNVEPTKVDIDWETDTRDGGDHLNLYGAVKVSDWIGKYLCEPYGLPDHREDPKYQAWNVALERYEELTD